MINPWLIKPEVAAIDGRLLGWQIGAESNQQLGVPSHGRLVCSANAIKSHEVT
jgi:hypothetical protein